MPLPYINPAKMLKSGGWNGRIFRNCLPRNRAILRAAPIRRTSTTPRKLFLTRCADSFCALIRDFFLSHKRFFLFRKKLFVTNFLTSVTNFVTRIRKFVICVTKFVTNFFYMMVKTVCAGRKKCHGDNEKYLAANICHRLIRALHKRSNCLKPRLVLAYFANCNLQSGGGVKFKNT